MTRVLSIKSADGIRLAGSAIVLASTLMVVAGCSGGSTSPGPPVSPSAAPTARLSGIVSVSGNQLLRDGVRWIPHGVQFIAFVAPPSAQTGLFATAYAQYSTSELNSAEAWGADTVRFQLSQPGANPQSPLYDAAFVAQYVAAVKYARSIGLNAIVSIQDETQSGQTAPPAQLPNAGTNRVWQNLAPMLNGDGGIIYEMLNEPVPAPNAADWQAYDTAMNATISTIRGTGATNTLLADGLDVAQSLDGLTPVTDPMHEVFYSVHPYYHSASEQMMPWWQTNWGNAAASVPVIVGEWTTIYNATDPGNFYCDANTPSAALAMLQYMQSIDVGLVAVGYDDPQLGSIVSDYNGTPTTFANGIACGATGFGPGTVIQNWYRTGTVPTTLE